MTLEEQLKLLKETGIVVTGELVLQKHVEHEIGNVESGGVGVLINNYGDDPKAGKDGEDDLADRLKPIFKNDAEKAKDFLHRIQGAKPTAVTALVKQLVKDGVIVEEMKYGELYKLLHDAGLYTCTPSNWNSQVKD